MTSREAEGGRLWAAAVSRPGTLSPAGEAGDEGRWRALALVSLAVLLGMSGWFTATAVGPELQARWQLGAAQGAWLTVLVQLGFVAGTAAAAVLNLADIVPARRYFSLSALLAALANGTLLLVPGFGTALLTRFLTGFFLAGVYPPGMKMIATWFRSARGLAIGTGVGALTVGKACPYLLKGLGGPSPTPVILGASLAGVVAAVLVAALYRDGPFAFERRPFSWALVGKIVRHRETALATGGYLGHMWELYAGWATLGAFFLYVFGQQGMSGARLASAAGLMAFTGIVMGGLGAVVAGAWADRWGRENVASWAMARPPAGSRPFRFQNSMAPRPWRPAARTRSP
jgi:MFS family permease